MPSLIPGMPGTKEAFGISLINDDGSINIPPKAYKHYGLANNTIVLLTSTHVGEGGLSILHKEKAFNSVFKTTIDKIETTNKPIWKKDRAYALTKLIDTKVILTTQLLDTFNLKIGDKLMVVKSTTIAISFTPIEIWKKRFEDRGLFEAIENMEKLIQY
jgi:hypothetical protein